MHQMLKILTATLQKEDCCPLLSLHTFDKQLTVSSVPSYWVLLSASTIFHVPSLLKAEEAQSSQSLLLHHVLPNHLGGPALDLLHYNLSLFLGSAKLDPSWITGNSILDAISQVPRKS